MKISLKAISVISLSLIILLAGGLNLWGGKFRISPSSLFKKSEPNPEVQNLKSILRFKTIIGLEEKELEHFAEFLFEETQRYGIDPYYVISIIEVESSYNPLARSDKNAVGLMQLIPSTALDVAQNQLGMDISSNQIESLLENPYFNVKIGIPYFSKLLHNFKNLKLATLAYFWGPTNVKKFIQASIFPETNYFDRVMSSYNELFQNFYRIAGLGTTHKK